MRAALLAPLLASLALDAFAADAEEGRKYVQEKKCEECHARKAPGGEAKNMYLRKERRVQSLPRLKGMVSMCNTELNLQLFPDDEEHVVEYLDREYYHFTKR